MADPYSMLVNANFASDYKVPDWVRQANFVGGSDPSKYTDFFAANPQYLEDWARITSGGQSAFSTDGSTLIRSNPNSMSPEAAAYYQKNPNELLAIEGFGQDPTLSYMNYFGGPGSIGRPKNVLSTDFLRNNYWNGQGISAGRASAQYGAPGSWANAQQYGSTRAPMGTSYGGGSMTSTFQQNPYADKMANTLGQQMGEQFQRQIAPQIASGAQLAGGYGGSRQGVLEANAANDLQQNTGQAIGTLLGNLYGQDLSYNLGMNNVGLGYANLDRNIANDNNQWGLQGAQLGMQLQDRQLQQNQLGLSNGSQIYNTPWNNLNQYGGLYNQIGQGFGSTSQSGGGGNPLFGAIGGAQMGNQIGQWWNSNNSMTSNGGWGTGNAYGNQDLGMYF